MGNVSQIVGLGSMILSQVFSFNSQRLNGQRQQQMMRDQQALVEKCPSGYPPQIETVNGQRVLVCPAPTIVSH